MSFDTNKSWRLQRPRGSGDESGALLVEFVLVVPIVLFLLGFILRLTMMLQAHLIAMSLSREIATDIFRRCADFSIVTQVKDSSGKEKLEVDTGNSTKLIVKCLAAAKEQVTTHWDDVKPIGTLSSAPTLTISVFRHNFSSLSPCSPAIGCTCPSGSTTKISDAGVDTAASNDPDLTSTCERNRMVKVNLSFEMTPISEFLNLLSTSGSPTQPTTTTVVEEAII